MPTLSFSGASDDLLHLSVLGSHDQVLIDDEGTQSKALDEISALKYRGWLITPADGPAFAVYAILGPVGATWCFAIGFPPGTDEDDGGDIGMVTTQTRQSPTCPYSTELYVSLGRCNVQAIEGKAIGA